jgi:class 3 adenylate cyclase
MSELTRIKFTPKASRPKNGLALIFDLEGFSAFFNKPDVNDYVSRFLNHVFDAVSTVIEGGSAYWDRRIRKPDPLSLQPVHVKFLGDGALYVWTTKEGKDFSTSFITNLCNRIFNLKIWFDQVRTKCEDDVPVVDLPARIRFGVARGTVFELSHSGSRRREYIGFCINLASRLQSYCPELGFIASARVMIPATVLKKHGYIKVVATKLKGFPNELVLVDSAEFNNLAEARRLELFSETSS